MPGRKTYGVTGFAIFFNSGPGREHHQEELTEQEENVEGTVSVGCGDLGSVEMLARLFQAFHERYPAVVFDLYTATADHIKDRMDQGLTDVGLLLEPINMEKYEYIRMQQKEEWVLAWKRQQPFGLAAHKFIDYIREVFRQNNC